MSRGHALPSVVFANICKIYTWREQNPTAPMVPPSLLSPRCPPAPLLLSPTSVPSFCSWVLAPVSCPGKGAMAHCHARRVMGCPALLQNRMAARLSLGNEDE